MKIVIKIVWLGMKIEIEFTRKISTTFVKKKSKI
jgi:hypothetical protein